MKNEILILAIISIVLLSGCTNQRIPGWGTQEGTTGGSPSVSISGFGPMTIGTDSQPVKNGKTVTLSAVFKNDGGAESTGGKAKIVGLGDDWVFDSETTREVPFDIKPGQEVRKMWKITAPQTSGFKMPKSEYPVEVRYQFVYGTAYRGSFRWISEESYNKLIESGDKVFMENTMKSKGLTVEKTSSGPIKIDLESIQTIGVPEVKLKIVNDGSGRLVYNQLQINEITGLNCPDITYDPQKPRIITLVGNTFETYCTVLTTGDDEKATDIQIKIGYEYYVKADSKIYYEDTGK